MTKGKEIVASITEQATIPDSGRLGEVVQWGITSPRHPTDKSQMVIVASLGVSFAQRSYVLTGKKGGRKLLE